jgi:hypothetical protein
VPVPLVPPDPWQVGDAYYSLRLDPGTGRYVVWGEGRVVRIVGGTLHLQTRTRGVITCSATECPAFKTRADGEEYLRENPRPDRNSRPMAGHGPSSAPSWQCLRCEQLREGLDPAVPEHAPRCPYRATGRDPQRDG